MEPASLQWLLSLTVSPSRSQLFEGEFLSLSCDEDDRSVGWTLKRNTTKHTGAECGHGWGRLSGSICNVSHIVPLDSGVYWCESNFGSSSSSSSIAVTGGSVILQSSISPVMEGHDVTLHCRTKSPPSELAAVFYKDGSLIRTGPAGVTTLRRVTKSDEGAYKCSINAYGESPSSWISVSGPTSPSSAYTPIQLMLRLLLQLLVLCPYCISTLLLASLYRPTEGSDQQFSRPTPSPIQAEQGLDDESDDVIDTAATQHYF